MNLLEIIKKHKIGFALSLIVISLVGLSFFFFSKDKNIEASYTTINVKQGDFSVSFSGSGQLSPTDKIELTAKTDGELTNIYVIKGEKVSKGDILAKVDSSLAQVNVDEAYVAYEVAKVELEDMVNPDNESNIVQVENSLKTLKENLEKTKYEQGKTYAEKEQDKKDLEKDLEDSYEDAYTVITNIFLSLPNTIQNIDDLIYSYEISEDRGSFNQTNVSFLKTSFNGTISEKENFNNLSDKLEEEYDLLDEKYRDSFENYKNLSRYSDKEEIENLLNDLKNVTNQAFDTLKLVTSIFDLWIQNREDSGFESFAIITSYRSNIETYISKISSNSSNISSALNSIQSNKKNLEDLDEEIKEMDLNYPIEIAQSERNIIEKENSLEDLKEGATELEIKNKELEVAQKLNAYREALQDLSDCKVTAPFDGVIAEINSSKGEDLKEGDSIITIITDNKMIEIPLNEVDVAEIEVGERAIITFDAIEDESFEGEVAEVDVLGEAEQGVVSYNVKVIFDTDNETIKIGMTANVDIITYENNEALTIPISLVRTMGENSYVEVLSLDNEILRKNVKTGKSNDTYIEILEGLSVEDKIISGTSAFKSTKTEKSLNNTNSIMNTMGPQNMGGPQMMR